jgi:hypothetical protein
LVVLWLWFFFLLLLLLLWLFRLLVLFLVWACLLCVVLPVPFLAGFAFVPLLPILWLVPLLVVRPLLSSVLVRFVWCGVLAVAFGFLFPVFLRALCLWRCVLGLFVWGVSGFVSPVRRLLPLRLWLLLLLLVCALCLVCSVGLVRWGFPVRVPRLLLR